MRNINVSGVCLEQKTFLDLIGHLSLESQF